MLGALNLGIGTLTKVGYQHCGESSPTIGAFRYAGSRINAETNDLYDFRARM